MELESLLGTQKTPNFKRIEMESGYASLLSLMSVCNQYVSLMTSNGTYFGAVEILLQRAELERYLKMQRGS